MFPAVTGGFAAGRDLQLVCVFPARRCGGPAGLQLVCSWFAAGLGSDGDAGGRDYNLTCETLHVSNSTSHFSSHVSHVSRLVRLKFLFPRLPRLTFLFVNSFTIRTKITCENNHKLNKIKRALSFLAPIIFYDSITFRIITLEVTT